jgi:hypothetical protein
VPRINETATSLSPDRSQTSDSSSTTADEYSSVSDISGLYSELNSKSSCRNLCFRVRYRMITSNVFYSKFVPCTGLAFFLCPYSSLYLFLSGQKVPICLIPLILQQSVFILIIIINIVNICREEYWFVTWNRESLGQ